MSVKEVIVAKSAGVCFGVDLALKLADRAVKNHPGEVTAYGPLVHNEDVIERLRKANVPTVNHLAELKSKKVLIRAHGATVKELSELETRGYELINATCPLVMKPQRKASEWSSRGITVVVVGHANHPEVRSVTSFANGKFIVVENLEDVEKKEFTPPLGVLSQTTLRKELFDSVIAALKERYPGQVESFDTICFATKERQDEARELSEKVDAMLVIGGRESSNTKKLVEVSEIACSQVDYFSGLEDLKTHFEGYKSSLLERGVKRLGVTAGASTPLDIIESILHFLSESLGAVLKEHDPSVQIGSEKSAIEEELRVGEL